VINAKLNRLLVENFAQLKETYIDATSWDDGDDTGAHVVYGDVFNPYVHDCITQNRKAEVKAVFDFIESILELDDEYAENVIAVTVLESIAYLFALQPNLVKYLGERSKAILSEIPVDLSRN